MQITFMHEHCAIIKMSHCTYTSKKAKIPVKISWKAIVSLVKKY